MRRRLAAAAIFVGILLILLWISQPSAHALAHHRKHRSTRASNPCAMPKPNESDISAATKSSDLVGEVQWDPGMVWGPPLP